MSKIKEKISRKFNKTKQEFINDISKVKIETDTKRQLFNKLNSYNKQIIKLYPIYLENYVDIMTFLYEDFNIKEAVLDGENTLIKDEMGLKDQCKDLLKEMKKIKVLDKLNINKKMRRWWILSTILQNYKDALELLYKYAGQIEYKGINITEELENLKKHNYLIETDLGTIAKNG